MGGVSLKRARPGAAATRGKTLPAWPLLTVFAVTARRRWLQIIHRKDHRGGRSSGRRGGFLSIWCHRHKCRSTLSETCPRREWLQQKPLASAGRVFNGNIYQLFAVRAGNNFCGVRTPKADGGGAKRHRSAASRPRIGGVYKMPPTLGAGATAR